jgi:hypothetical protein
MGVQQTTQYKDVLAFTISAKIQAQTLLHQLPHTNGCRKKPAATSPATTSATRY